MNKKILMFLFVLFIAGCCGCGGQANFNKKQQISVIPVFKLFKPFAWLNGDKKVPLVHGHQGVNTYILLDTGKVVEKYESDEYIDYVFGYKFITRTEDGTNAEQRGEGRSKLRVFKFWNKNVTYYTPFVPVVFNEMTSLAYRLYPLADGRGVTVLGDENAPTECYGYNESEFNAGLLLFEYLRL